MSTPPESPSPRSILREFAGLFLVAAGAITALITLGAIHPLISTHVAVVATAALSIWSPPKSRYTRMVTNAAVIVSIWSALTCAFLTYAPLGWLEVAAGVIAAGVWLASEGV